MRFKEILETPYLDKITKQIAPAQKTGAPVPSNKLPKGPVKTQAIKSPLNTLNKRASQALVKKGSTIPLPTSPNQETDYEIDQVGTDTVTMKTAKPTSGAPEKVTVSKKDLDPILTNLSRRTKATSR
jgi:hypothetical protein|tara:strand:+ start:388 stop:768 length:381 start_codon:yes stop_codon:yes gene_type:complete